MAKNQTIYTCQKCGAQFLRWQGRCDQCQSWSTIVLANETTGQLPEVINLGELELKSAKRLTSGWREFDRVLGGGLVAGSLVLLGGDPGIGKSTLALSLAKAIKNLLYVSGEESASQIKARAERIGLDLNDLKFLGQTELEAVANLIKKSKPPLVIIDSIQTLAVSGSEGLGTIGQITLATSRLLALAKETGTTILIVGHVTKEGAVAGPKALEHLVDTVLYLENDNKNHYKILRSVKNRFGQTGEVGIFEMTNSGLKEIKDVLNIFLSRQNQERPGVAISLIWEGSRPFLVEIQALVSRAPFGYPQRKASGFDANRLAMLIAVISKIAKINLSNQDVYLNVAGGLKIKETGPDLAVCLAIVSAFLNLPIDNQTLILGEVGLSGEVRPVGQMANRVNQALKLNFKKIIAAKDGLEFSRPELQTIDHLTQAIRIINQNNHDLKMAEE